MVGMIEVTDEIGMDYYFVKVSLNYEWLVIRPGTAMCKDIFKTIYVPDITDLIYEKGKIAFSYEGEQFIVRPQENQMYHLFVSML